MSTPLTPLPIRLFCDLALRGEAPIDLNTGQPPFFFRGDDVEIDIGIGANGSLLAPSLGNVTSVTCQIFLRQNDTGGPQMSSTVAAAGMNLGLTQAQWTNDTTPFCHVAFVFGNSQTCIPLNGLASMNCWLRITAQTTDSPAKTVTLLDGPITVKDGPVSTLNAPTAGGLRLWTIGGEVVPQLLNGDDGKYYTIGLRNINGVPTLWIGDTGY